MEITPTNIISIIMVIKSILLSKVQKKMTFFSHHERSKNSRENSVSKTKLLNYGIVLESKIR